jgi:AraC-like DNA-binding protein
VSTPFSRRERTSPVTISCTSGPIESARLRDAFRDCLTDCATNEDLEVAVNAGPVDLVIVSPWDRTGRSTAAVIRRIRQRSTWPALACYVDVHLRPRDLLTLGNAGCVEIIIRDLDDSIASLRDLPFRAATAIAAREAEDSCLRLLPSGVRPMAQLCFESIGPLRASEISTRLCVGRRALSKRAARLGLRGVSGLSVRCRLLVAVTLLTHCRFNVEAVAHGLGYSSATHLRNTLKRYTGCLIGDIRRESAVTVFAEQLFTRHVTAVVPLG